MAFLYRFLPSRIFKVEEVDNRVKLETPPTTIVPSLTFKEETAEDECSMPGSFWGTPSKPSTSMAYPSPALTPERRRRDVLDDEPISPPVTPLKSRSKPASVASSSARTSATSSSARTSTTSSSARTNKSQSSRETPALLQPVSRRSTRITSERLVRPEVEPVLLTPPTTPARAPRQSRASKREVEDLPRDEINIFNVRPDNTVATRPRSTRSRTSAAKSPTFITLDDLEFDTPIFVQAGPSSEPPALLLQGPSGIFRNGEKLQYFQAQDLHLLLQRERGEPVCGTDVINNVGHVLAYDMGCGKTVMSISLIVLNPPPLEFEGVKTTLVIVPSQGIIDHWLNEIKIFAPHLKAWRYDSVKQSLRLDVDVIICTFAQIQRQYSAKKEERSSKAPLYDHVWYRIITDEAHVFRNPRSETAHGVWALQKKHGLCLTGTPAQNSVKDFYPLFRFLEVKHEGIDDLKTYISKIVPKTKRSLPPVGAERLLTTLKESFFVVREKIDPKTGIKLVDLPNRIDHIVDVHLTSYEADVYEHIKALPLKIFAKFTHTRQACIHPALVAGHVEREQLCRSNPERNRIFSSSGIFNYNILSSKMRAMLDILRMRPSKEKTIIFTHFTAVIKGITQALDDEDITWVKYSGDMNTKQREESLKRIKEDSGCSVIIISILAGGVGLNITSCSSVILLDPWWNPYVEEQAISRVHRIGQDKLVNVYHLVTVDTVEVYIMETQAIKRQMIEGNPDGNYNDAFEDQDMDKFDEERFREWLAKTEHDDSEDAAWRGMYKRESDEIQTLG